VNRYRTILLFGRPGSGKGTIGKSLGAVPGFFHMACGDVFRNLDLSTPLGKIFDAYSSKGELVPDDATVQLWKVTMEAQAATHRFRPDSDLLVLDGIPRNQEQAAIMEDLIEVERVFHLVCTDEAAMIERLRRRALRENRFDDASEEVIRRRWEIYRAESKPVLDYYPKEKIEHIDAMGTPAKVLYDILGRALSWGLVKS
jgi:adenylate kinase